MDIAKHGDKARKILPPLLVVVMVFLAALQFRIDNQAGIIANSTVILGDMAEQCGTNLNDMFYSDSSGVQTLSRVYAEKLVAEDTREAALKEIEDIEIFNYVRYIDKDGINHSSSGKLVDARDREYYLQGIIGKSGICYILDSRQNTENMIGFYAPVVMDGSVEGVLIGFLSQQQLFQSLTREIYGFSTVSFIVSKDGTVIGSSDENTLGKSIFTAVDFGMSSPLRRAFLSMASSEEPKMESIEYSSAGGRNVAFLCPMIASDCYFLQTFPDEILTYINHQLGSSGESLFLNLTIIFLVYIIYTFVSNLTASRKKEESSRLVTEGLGNENDFIFIWNLMDGSVRIIKDSTLIPHLLEPISRSGDVNSFFSRFAEKYVIAADRELFIQKAKEGFDVKEVRKNQIHRYVCRVLVEGKVYYLQWNHQVMVSSKRQYLMFTVRNITDFARKEFEEKYQLKIALEAAEKATRAKSTFLANMSHDIRTPMNAIVGFTNMASTHIEDTEKVKDSLSKISVSSQHLLSLINDVLDMTRIEGGKIKLEESNTSLPEILNGLFSISQTEIAQRSINFRVVGKNLVHEDVVCDKLRVNQILLNCLSNAIKYTPEGGFVTLGISEIWDERSDSSIYEFSVKDTGIGMAPEFLEHIFEPFERERNSTISGIQGTGLGMTITKNLVDLMGGQIVVKSEVGKGSEFIISIKMKHSTHSVSSSLEHYRGKKALVVGTSNTCQAACSAFYRIGLDVTRVETVSAMLEHAVEAEVFFTDSVCLEKQGKDLGLRFRELCPVEDPVVILSFYHLSDEARKEAMKQGFNHFVMKPLFTSDLETILISHLKDSEKQVEEAKTYDLSGKRVLVVEDNALNRDIALFILQDAGMDVEFAENGKIGYEKVRDHEAYYYDMVLMDIQMPVMNGVESSKAIRALEDKAKATLPIVAMTANAFEEDRRQTKEAGMDAHIPKPIEIDQLLMTMAEIFQRKNLEKLV